MSLDVQGILERAGVLSVIDSCRDRFGVLDDDGYHLEWCVRHARACAHLGMEEATGDYVACALSSAETIRANKASMRNVGLVPRTMLASRRAANRRAALAQVGAA